MEKELYALKTADGWYVIVTARFSVTTKTDVLKMIRDNNLKETDTSKMGGHRIRIHAVL